MPAGRLPPDPRLLDHADARQRSSLRPGQAPACRSASVARPCFAADQIAYINFSSGTTGRPKAIACTHAGITRLCLGQSFLAFAPQMRFSVNSPLSFDAATLEIWGALLNGGCCVLNDLGPSTRACCAS
ncbi:AMP-binding protein [Pseudomonas aeruginosa]|nr:AMP-binding protein [Pseudomonas aeruginosa]